MNLKKLFSAVAVAVCAFVSTQAAQLIDTFAQTGTAIAATNSYVVISAANGKARVGYINGTSDKSASAFRFWTASTPTPITVATNSGQVTVFCVPAGITNNNIVVLRNASGDTYQRLVVSSATSTTLTFTANLTYASALGDVIWLMTAGPTIPVGAATKEINALPGAFYNGQKNLPVLIDLDGTSSVTLNAVTGWFDN